MKTSVQAFLLLVGLVSVMGCADRGGTSGTVTDLARVDLKKDPRYRHAAGFALEAMHAHQRLTQRLGKCPDDSSQWAPENLDKELNRLAPSRGHVVKTALALVKEMKTTSVMPMLAGEKSPVGIEKDLDAIDGSIAWLTYLVDLDKQSPEFTSDMLEPSRKSVESARWEMAAWFAAFIMKDLASDIRDRVWVSTAEETYYAAIQKVLGTKLVLPTEDKKIEEKDQDKAIRANWQRIKQHFYRQPVDMLRSQVLDCLNARAEYLVDRFYTEDSIAFGAAMQHKYLPETYDFQRTLVTTGMAQMRAEQIQARHKEVLADMEQLKAYHLPVRYARMELQLGK